MWIGRELRRRAGGRVNVVLSQRQTASDGQIVSPTKHERRQTFSAIKLPGICSSCNNNWMSQIEEAASPILKAMMNDQQTSLSTEDQFILARWGALKTLVADLIDHGFQTFSRLDYKWFYDNRVPPPDFLLRLGRIDTSGQDVHYFSLQPIRTGLNLNGIQANNPFYLDFEISFGPVYMTTRYFNLNTGGYPRPSEIISLIWWTLVWPQNQSTTWPPSSTITPEMLPDNQGAWPELQLWIDKNLRRKK